ncbi:hypothetical protein MHOCP_23430 [Moorella humiferrea]|uniref:zf-HC2 domain-containing protein n=1 Tax=Neomoorella humiferrea TaxID=676965 RepID=UPI0030D2BD4E
MRCLEARELFSPYLDGELPPAERERLRQHLEECRACSSELRAWQDISLALRQTGAPVAAPPGLLAEAAARLAARRRPWQGVRRWAAAAAAAVLLVAGSLGYAGLGLWQQLPAITAAWQHEGGQQVAVANPDAGKEPPAVNLLPESGSIQPEKPAGQQPGGGETPGKDQAPVNSGGGSAPPGTTPGAVKNPGGSSGGQPARVAAGEPYVARNFLNDRRQASSTMLKIAVEDMAGARAKALSLAAGSGAIIQTIADQDDGREKRVIFMFKVAEDRAAALLAGLGRLGQVLDSSSTTRDLTQQFSTTLEQYQAKVAQVNATADPAEKEKLTREARALEQQLLTWEEETKQHTIILWLETR